MWWRETLSAIICGFDGGRLGAIIPKALTVEDSVLSYMGLVVVDSRDITFGSGGGRLGAII